MSQTVENQQGTADNLTVGTTVVLSIANAVAPGSTLLLCVGWFNLATLPASVTIASTTGISFSTDAMVQNDFSYGLAICSGYAAAGINSGQTFTATVGSVSSDERYIFGHSRTKMSPSSRVVGSNSATGSGDPFWVGGSVTPTAQSSVIGAVITDTGSITFTPLNPFGEVPTPAGDWNEPSTGVAMEQIYEINAVAGTSYAPGGTFSAGSGTYAGLSVAYRDLVSPVVEAIRAVPMRRQLSYR